MVRAEDAIELSFWSVAGVLIRRDRFINQRAVIRAISQMKARGLQVSWLVMVAHHGAFMSCPKALTQALTDPANSRILLGSTSSLLVYMSAAIFLPFDCVVFCITVVGGAHHISASSAGCLCGKAAEVFCVCMFCTSLAEINAQCVHA